MWLRKQIDINMLQKKTLQWRHNGQDGVSNHQPHDCLHNCLFRRRSKKRSKLRVTGLCAWNSPVTSEFLVHMASNDEKVSIWWRLMNDVRGGTDMNNDLTLQCVTPGLTCVRKCYKLMYYCAYTHTTEASISVAYQSDFFAFHAMW